MKPILLFITVCLLAVSGCKKNELAPTDSGNTNTTAFQFIAGRSWLYSGQSYETNGIPMPNSALQTSLTVQTSGQTIGGMANAAVIRTAYTQGTHFESGNVTVAYDQDRLLVYNGTGSSAYESPAFPAWTALFDFKKDGTVRSLLSFDSTYVIAMRSGRILRDRVRYNATMRYLGDESVSAFNTASLPCSKYAFAFTYDAVIDTGGIVLYNGNVINASLTIWFSQTVGFVKFRGDGVQLLRGGLPDLSALKISHNLTARYHYSPGVFYYYYDFGSGFVLESFSVTAGSGAQAGYSIFDGFSKNF